MAQLGARLDGIEEVVGSNPIGSTNLRVYGPRRSFTGCTGYIRDYLSLPTFKPALQSFSSFTLELKVLSQSG